MQTIRVYGSDSAPELRVEETEAPTPGLGEVLVRVHAAGVTPTELSWYPTWHTAAGGDRLAAILGHEFSGVVEAVGEGVSGVSLGDAVFGMNDWFADGATAEHCIAKAADIAHKPPSLSHTFAATVPISALTAWQGLVERAQVKPGERVLVLGGTGAVGLFAVQIARLEGAHVIATTSAQNAALARALGANETVDYEEENYERGIEPADIVFDGVGGATLDRAWSLLKPGGRMVTIAADSEGTGDARVKDAFFIVKPDGARLAKIAAMIDEHKLRAFVNATVPLIQAPDAYTGRVRDRSHAGKVAVVICN